MKGRERNRERERNETERKEEMRLKERERERGTQIVKKIGRDKEEEMVMYADEFFKRVSDRVG